MKKKLTSFIFLCCFSHGQVHRQLHRGFGSFPDSFTDASNNMINDTDSIPAKLRVTVSVQPYDGSSIPNLNRAWTKIDLTQNNATEIERTKG